ncbi:MAG: dTDP-4-dehydrorhamnose reductase [Polyangiaceae bacterium]|jgi:dTDP-4-dehydrorhamnose reductase|nr:dTDP-4-dehydrorhamnose reductase [Polyangiaceae bacterium]
MRVVVLGADGQVGHELVAVLRLFADVIPAVRAVCDLADGNAVARLLAASRPNVVVNAAAYSHVDAAEADEDRAAEVNARAVGMLGELALAQRFGLVHFSTDFVFDGTKGTAYREDDEPRPLSAYGRTKLAGEQLLRDLEAPAIVLRTAWVYSTRRKSFVSTILRLARLQEQLSVVVDRCGNPTFSRDLAESVALMLRGMAPPAFEKMRDARGVYHLAGAGLCSRYDLAVSALALDPMRSQHVVREVIPVGTSEFPETAPRPRAVDLDCAKAHHAFGIRLPPWRDSLARALDR